MKASEGREALRTADPSPQQAKSRLAGDPDLEPGATACLFHCPQACVDGDFHHAAVLHKTHHVGCKRVSRCG